jgi:two-component system response regulator DevR
MPAVRVLIADDHPVFRAGLRALMASTGDLEVVEEAGTVEEAVHRSARGKPDVVVMDLRLPDGSGIDATRRILAERPGVAILMLSITTTTRPSSTRCAPAPAATRSRARTRRR